MPLRETHFKYEDTNLLTLNGWRMISLVNINLKRAGAAILDKVYVKAEKMTRDKKKKKVIPQ